MKYFSRALAKDMAILTPYLVPASMRRKRVNLGDGFILRAIERHIGQFPSNAVFSSRIPPESQIIERFQRKRGVILGGANQLSDNFAPWPGMLADEIRRLRIRFIPFGIGINGVKQNNTGFTPEAVEIIKEIHEYIEYSSWRCPRTIAVLKAAFPNLKHKFLMTGCPVLYDRPLLEGRSFSRNMARIAVTVTERDDFLERELRTLEDVARHFPDAEKFLVLHQDFRKLRNGAGQIARFMLPKRLLGDVAVLHAHAQRLGYQLIIPSSADQCIKFYDTIDLHVGSRLHAHLLFLSRNKWSYLTYVDDRCLGFSEFLGFPILKPGNLVQFLDFDFEIVRNRAQENFATMEKFIQSMEKK